MSSYEQLPAMVREWCDNVSTDEEVTVAACLAAMCGGLDEARAESAKLREEKRMPDYAAAELRRERDSTLAIAKDWRSVALALTEHLGCGYR